MFRIRKASWPSHAILLLLAASTLSTKAAGAFWFSLVLLGIYYWLKKPQEDFQHCAHADLKTMDSLAQGWLYFCLLALALKSIPMVYWSGPWEERHAEFRLLIGAIGSFLLLRYRLLPKSWFVGAGHALSLSCVLAFLLTATLGSIAAPTNRIPWTAGVSILSCVLLTWSFLIPTTAVTTSFWRVSSLLGLCTVLMSGVRGSYMLILVWPTLWWFLGRQSSVKRSKNLYIKAMIAIGIAITTIVVTPPTESPLHRAKQVMIELGISENHGDVGTNNSNGARVVLWKSGIQAFQDHWFLGLGFTGGKALIKQTADEKQLPEIRHLGHYHNDYIHTAVEFGILGLLSFLCYSFGMAWCAWRLHHAGFATSAAGMLSVLLMHMTAAITNMNFAHNYYPTILSVGVSLLLFITQRHSSHDGSAHSRA